MLGLFEKFVLQGQAGLIGFDGADGLHNTGNPGVHPVLT
jgi:hypothetical protein